MSYAPSKGFRVSELARDKKLKLPVELGFPKNMLAETAGIPEPEGLRSVVHVWSDGSELLEPAEGTLASGLEWSRIVKGLRLLTDSKNVVAEEKKQSRNQQKAAKQRVKTLIVVRARRLLSENSELTVIEALSAAECAVLGNLKCLEVCGFDISNLVYCLQDNSKTKEPVTQ